MMKRTLHSLILLLVFIYSACTEERLLSPEQQADEVVVRFRINIPAFRLEHTRSSSIDENVISSLSLLLFNEEGNFIKREEAGLSSPGSFIATLPQSTEARIVHFITNYDWQASFDALAAGKSEGEVIAALTTENGMSMWAREELPDGISATTFTTGTVELIRNMAKISIDNQATASFTLNGFYLYRAPTHGTVAPFDAGAYLFTGETLTEPAGSTYNLESGLLSPTDSWYLYERQNRQSSNDDYLFIVLKGTYNGIENYYKIDLLNANRIRCDIIRNHHYQVTLKSVLKEGYSSPEAAVTGDPSNGSLEVSVSQSPIISDGISRLEVDQTLILFTRNGSSLDVGFRYYDDINGNTFNNSGVTVELIEHDPANPVVNGFLNVVNPGTDNGVAKITAAINDVPAGEETRTASVVVCKGDLVRTIRLVLHRAYSFEPVTINGDNIAPLTGQGTGAMLSFSIPADYPAELLPLEVQIKTQGLTPAQSGLRLVVENGEISYIYKATTSGIQNLSFKTSYPSYYEVVQLDATGFVTGTTGYNVQENTGYINYIDDSITRPVPHAGTADLTASEGYISIPVNDGEYTWAYPNGTINSDSVVISFRKQESVTHTRLYQKETTAGELINNDTITLELSSNIARGSITYGATSNPLPSDAVLALSVSGVPLTMAAEGSYEYIYAPGANDPDSVTISYSVSINSRMSELYAKTVSFSDLYAGIPIHLEPISNNIKGIITYGPSYAAVPQGSAITYVPATFPEGITFSILNYSDYEFIYLESTTFPTDDPLYTFNFEKDGTTYQAVVSLNYLKEGKRIHLNNLTTNPANSDVYFFGTISYRKDGLNYPILKDEGSFTIQISNPNDLNSASIVEDGLYKMELYQIQNDNYKINFLYVIDGQNYRLEIRYGDLKANPNIILLPTSY